MTPVDGSSERPSGSRLIESTVYVYGPVPPVAPTVTEYRMPTKADARVAPVNVSVEDMTIEQARVAVILRESVASTVKLKVPEAVGVPDITPELEIVSPAGSEPTLMLNVTGGVPPVVENPGAVYAVPVVPAGRACGTIDSGAVVPVVIIDPTAAIAVSVTANAMPEGDISNSLE